MTWYSLVEEGRVGGPVGRGTEAGAGGEVVEMMDRSADVGDSRVIVGGGWFESHGGKKMTGVGTNTKEGEVLGLWPRVQDLQKILDFGAS